MKKRTACIALIVLTIAPAVILWGFQARHSQQWEWEMQDPIDDPPDANVKAEFTFARLRYRPLRYGGRGRGFRGGGRSSWGVDANRADRLFATAMRRLTRVNTQSVEDVVDIDDGQMNNYPWLYAVEVGRWNVDEQQAKNLREYLDRGGFLMVDDFHGMDEWESFMESFRRVFPDRQVVQIPEDNAIFHMLGDLGDRVQVPGAQYIRSGLTYERYDGYPARWMGVFDDKGRLQVAICHNMDLGDAWQYADYPEYPEKFATLAIKVSVNYVTYAMTH